MEVCGETQVSRTRNGKIQIALWSDELSVEERQKYVAFIA